MSNQKLSDITRKFVTTRRGDTLGFFFNAATNLLVVDLISSNEMGGNEIIRMTIDEESLLGHVDELLPEDEWTEDEKIIEHGADYSQVDHDTSIAQQIELPL